MLRNELDSAISSAYAPGSSEYINSKSASIGIEKENITLYSQTPLNQYLSVDSPRYGLSGIMGFER